MTIQRIRIDVRHLDDGVDRVVARISDDRSDSFVLVHGGKAATEWLSMADVIVAPTEHTCRAARDSSAAALERLPGCTLVAVGIPRYGCLLRCRDGAEVLLPTDERSADRSFHFAVLGYAIVAWTGTSTQLTRGPVG